MVHVEVHPWDSKAKVTRGGYLTNSCRFDIPTYFTHVLTIVLW